MGLIRQSEGCIILHHSAYDDDACYININIKSRGQVGNRFSKCVLSIQIYLRICLSNKAQHEI